MAKRFTDTNKYKKRFFRGLPGAYKLFWDYLYHDCNNAGIWQVDLEIAQIYLGSDMQIGLEKALELFNSDEARIIVINEGKKWYITGFIEFQYKCTIDKLNPNNNAHKSVIYELKKHNISSPSGSPLLAPAQPLVSPCPAPQDKDKDKDNIKLSSLKKNSGENRKSEISENDYSTNDYSANVNSSDNSQKQKTLKPNIPKPKPKKKEPTKDGKGYAKAFAKLLPNDRKITAADLKNWAITYDELIRIDGRDKQQIWRVTKWAREDPFWVKNFLSAKKLRQSDKSGTPYYDVFLAQMRSKNGNGTVRNGRTESEEGAVPNTLNKESEKILEEHFARLRKHKKTN